MATGDHGLTAISVAKKCKIIDEGKPVYFGELESNGDKKFVWWQLMKHHKDEDQAWESLNDDDHIKNLVEGESNEYKSVDNKSLDWVQNQGTKKLIKHIWKEDEEMNEEDNPDNSQISPERLDTWFFGSASDRIPPWAFLDQPYEIAMTGAAFEHLWLSDDDLDWRILKNVCIKGRVFAWMSPEGKAFLVEQV